MTTERWKELLAVLRKLGDAPIDDLRWRAASGDLRYSRTGAKAELGADYLSRGALLARIVDERFHNDLETP
jgi:hypothetical protein